MVEMKFGGNIDTSKIQKLMQKATVEVGFPSGISHPPKSENGKQIDMAELAAILSYGSANIPARPFLKEGLLQNKKQLLNALKKSYEILIKTGKDNLDQVAQMAVAGIQRLVRSKSFFAPNAESTKRQKKGKDTPLIDTGLMMKSVQYRITRKKVITIGENIQKKWATKVKAQ